MTDKTYDATVTKPIKRPKFTLTQIDKTIVELVDKTDHKILAVWAIECAERVLPYFEKRHPKDRRPRKAIETLQTWIETGRFSMAEIRKASLDSHAAAREVGEDNPARSAARAAGQAVATAHVKTHSIGAAIYAQQALFRATDPAEAEILVAREQTRQYRRLLKLKKLD